MRFDLMMLFTLLFGLVVVCCGVGFIRQSFKDRERGVEIWRFGALCVFGGGFIATLSCLALIVSVH